MTEETLTQLGAGAPVPASPTDARLERIANPHPNSQYLARFTCPEFTTLCPVTGQPDFAQLVIDYVPNRWLVESKSLKLYLASFRNHGNFHEDCTVGIAKRLEDMGPSQLSTGNVSSCWKSYARPSSFTLSRCCRWMLRAKKRS